MSHCGICRLLSHQELSQTPSGLAKWDAYMAQVTEIALQYPSHFTESVAKEAIPHDARTHRFYALLSPEGEVTAFCVVVTTHMEAELLWLAVHRTHRRKGYATELLRFIEAELFSPESSIFMIIGKPATPDARLYGTEIGGSQWLETNLFHRKMGYTFCYKLEDYWETGDHAAFFVKRRNPKLYGYSALDDSIALADKKPTITSDIHPIENAALQEDIRHYVAAFSHEVARKRDPVEKVFGDSGELHGFAGLAFLPARTEVATLFSNATQPYSHKFRFKYRFEYKKDASALTRILFADNTQETGTVHYPVRYDVESDIQVHEFYFKMFLPELATSDGYTLFYHKVHNANTGSICAIYFVTPVLQNVTAAKRNWQTFSDYSFALFLGIGEVIQTLLETSFKRNAYLMSLYDCISIPIELDRIEGKYSEMRVQLVRRQISKRLLQLERERVKAKESAIIHYGHTLGHRLSPILAYVEGNEDSRKRAKSNAVFLRDLSLVLQANNLDSLDELYQHPKKARFLDYDEGGGEFDLVDRIRNEWQYLAESYQPVRVSAELSQERVMTFIEFTGPLQSAKISYMLVDQINDRPCRPKEAFYSQLFSELLLNAVRYSGIPKNQIDLKEKTATIRVAVASQHVEHNSAIAPVGCAAITLANKIGHKPLPPWLSQTSWALWPSDRENDGPGIAIALLRRLGLGELWHRYSPAKQVFRVAVWLRGLDIEEGDKTS